MKDEVKQIKNITMDEFGNYVLVTEDGSMIALTDELIEQLKPQIEKILKRKL